jgi:hypothetical protein
MALRHSELTLKVRSASPPYVSSGGPGIWRGLLSDFRVRAPTQTGGRPAASLDSRLEHAGMTRSGLHALL